MMINFHGVLVRLAENIGITVDELNARPDCNLSYEELTRAKPNERHPYDHWVGFKGQDKADALTEDYKYRPRPNSMSGKGAWVRKTGQDDRTVAMQVKDDFNEGVPIAMIAQNYHLETKTVRQIVKRES